MYPFPCSLYVPYVKLICPLFSPPASRFLDLRNDESADVRVNLPHQGEEGDGDGNGGLFNVNPRVTEALNEVTHIYSDLDDNHDLPQNGPPFFIIRHNIRYDVHTSPIACNLCIHTPIP